ncbi:hypothetical protein ACFFX1_11015 [Dactylosporangium sucinum]|uniref:Uncharacterized protein n=1 Tax=Dactylosporangium sucinum TaxID=1424081 RepID=A0A917TJ15_9ACTN|nr:hypothetical protein [Dactylosporangium sucinum]GGM22619.1 hypothetical protein GCM10007977_024740 [Dactylosporangium sucinum]
MALGLQLSAEVPVGCARRDVVHRGAAVSIWVMVAALAAVPLLVAIVGARIGFGELEVCVLAELATLGPVFALAWRLTSLAGISGVPRPSGYLPWLVLVGPTVLVTLIVAVAHILPGGRGEAVPAVGRCERCAEALFTDLTGHRYYSLEGQYLCPPALRAPGDRRHHLVAG